MWGAGHMLTVMLVGGAIILFGLVLLPRVVLSLELAVGVMSVGPAPSTSPFPRAAPLRGRRRVRSASASYKQYDESGTPT